MPKFDDARLPEAKRKQVQELSNAPGLRDYYKEQELVAANMARLRALRLAKEAEQTTEVAVSSKPRAKRKPVVRRGIGSA